jgi:hypothetical protein
MLRQVHCCHLDKLQWQVGAWGPCLPVSPADVNHVAALHQPVVGDGRHDNLGVTQRNVSCVLVSHEATKVHMHYVNIHVLCHPVPQTEHMFVFRYIGRWTRKTASLSPESLTPSDFAISHVPRTAWLVPMASGARARAARPGTRHG